MQCPSTHFPEAPSTGLGLTWILKHADRSACDERWIVSKEQKNQVGDGTNGVMGSQKDGNGGGGLQDL